MKIQVIVVPFQTHGRKEGGIISLTWTLHPDCSCPNNVRKELLSSNKMKKTLCEMTIMTITIMILKRR
jgi:hypothetical protein